MKAVLIVVAFLMLAIMDPIINSDSPSFAQAACVGSVSTAVYWAIDKQTMFMRATCIRSKKLHFAI
uniref:Uncharacterized protein n=1 Tax=Romanomermis culicivorax TaxID=13658 RepID=A0A915IQ60_ROMCU